MLPEEIFSRFASRILLLTCDISADDSMEASGVLVSADGFVVTNAHVVEGCRSISATRISGASRRSTEAVLKYYDKKSDTAVLKAEGQGFEFFDLPARTARVGERVYAIGNPRGLEQSISEGIVSGLREEDGISWIQHSAPISPGSSGGALISSRGELLGINSWFVREAQGLNFAVPASTLASAYSGARDLQGFLRFPALPPVSQAQATPPIVHKESPLPAPPSAIAPGSPSFGEGQQDALIRKAAGAALNFTETLANYVCQELVTRYVSESTPARWLAQDVVTMEVVYEGGEENYWNITVGGRPFKGSMDDIGGAWSTGEYGANLVNLFNPGTAAQFHFKQDSRAGGVMVKEYGFEVAHENSRWQVKFGSQVYVPGYTGNVWIDPSTGRVLRIEMDARNFPDKFGTDHVESATDYEYVNVDGTGQHLLPVHAEYLSCQRGTSNCSRNTLDFRNYHLRPVERSVRLNVTVSDKSGHRVTGLPESAFTILENGAPQQIKIFKLEDVPVSVGLIIDNSANMRAQRANLTATALALVRDSSKDDEVFIVNFNDRAFLDLPQDKDFTSDISEMEEALGRIDSRGRTAMRDAVQMSIDHLRTKTNKGKKVLVLVTDGDDNASVVSLEGLVKASQESNVLIYVVGLLGSAEKHEAERAKKDLNVLAESTGGESFFPKDISEADRIAHQVAHDIRNQYTIAYTPTNGALDGSFRAVSVVVKGPGSPVARTLPGYYATK
jgi:VWFA-related protein